jgi:VacB/RNase II family 3'-5' exoribonuclease
VNPIDNNHHNILKSIAHRAMIEKGLLADFSAKEVAEVGKLQTQTTAQNVPGIRDMRGLLWCSIDNDESRDLDQLAVGETLPSGMTKILVAVADVDSLVGKQSVLDQHAHTNTTSVYTAAAIFPMLPERLSTDLTSLNFNEDRLAVVIEMTIGPDGALHDSDIYRAWVHNRAKLAYNSVAGWLENDGPVPPVLAAVEGLAQNLQLQDRAAQNMKNFRHLQGALSFETIEARPVFVDDQISALEIEQRNRAKEMIENFMVTANSVTALFLSAKKFPSIRRVVRVPKRWDRIVEIAKENKFNLPTVPDSKALEDFLVQQKAADPERFPDLSLSVIKLLGAGEYVAQFPDEKTAGHFGLAVKDYSHSTAPNRRYPDLVTQRLLKAALAGQPVPYAKDELDALAAHCTQAQDLASKVERQVSKSAAALLLESRIGEQFDSFVTGASEKGTWVRLLTLPVEGKLVDGFQGLDVGQRVRVQLVDTNVEKGFIDFKRITTSDH